MINLIAEKFSGGPEKGLSICMTEALTIYFMCANIWIIFLLHEETGYNQYLKLVHLHAYKSYHKAVLGTNDVPVPD